MNEIKVIPLSEYEAQHPAWPEPDMRYLRSELPEPPLLPLRDVFSPKWAEWMEAAAEAKASPIDYVMAAVLSVCGSVLGNARWPLVWEGWQNRQFSGVSLSAIPAPTSHPASMPCLCIRIVRFWRSANDVLTWRVGLSRIRRTRSTCWQSSLLMLLARNCAAIKRPDGPIAPIIRSSQCRDPEGLAIVMAGDGEALKEDQNRTLRS